MSASVITINQSLGQWPNHWRQDDTRFQHIRKTMRERHYRNVWMKSEPNSLGFRHAERPEANDYGFYLTPYCFKWFHVVDKSHKTVWCISTNTRMILAVCESDILKLFQSRLISAHVCYLYSLITNVSSIRGEHASTQVFRVRTGVNFVRWPDLRPKPNDLISPWQKKGGMSNGNGTGTCKYNW